MPFIAVDLQNNRPRIPIGVKDNEPVKCPVCDDVLRVRDGPSIARHFYHPPDSSCAGESALHLAMKSIAVDKLKAEYPDAEVHVEFTTDEIPRRADVLVDFSQPQYPLGNGIAVEVQYRNKQKDLTETTASYLIGDYSVLWLFEDNYEGDYPDYADVELPPPISVWPYSIPHGDIESSQPSASEYLGITEGDLVSILPNHIDGQVSLGEFPSTIPSDDSSPPITEWHKESEIHLRLSPSTEGVLGFYATWLDGHIRSRTPEVRTEMEERWEIAELERRYQFITHTFRGGTSNTFEFSIGVKSSLTGKFLLHQYIGRDKATLYTRVDQNLLSSFLEFVKPLCFELDFADSLLPSGNRERIAEGTLYDYTYAIFRTPYEQVLVRLQAHGESALVEFNPSHLSALIEICAKLHLWYERFPE